MKNILITLCLMMAAVACAIDTPEDEMNRIEAMSTALQSGGVAGLLKTVQSNGWSCPRIPSKWHVETRCPSNEWQKVLSEARDLGLALAVTLDGEAPDFQVLPSGEELDRRTTRLCDLSEWCSATTGYGNVFLAQRSLDLAAVGLARLTADLDYPLASCEKLAARMQPDWMSVESRAAVFNDEAGAKLFSGREPPEELERMLGTGKYLLKLSQGWNVPLGWRTDPSRYADRKLFGENLDFFSFVEDDSVAPYTLVAQWNYQRYFRIANGLELQTIRKALPLVEFRRIVGAFPERIVRTPEELRKRDEEIAFYSTQGIKVSKDEDAPYYNPMREAFGQAWLKKQPNLPIARYNDYGNAFQAYDEVKRGSFLDHDTSNARLFKEQQERREKIRRKMEESRAAGASYFVTNAVSRP